MFGQSGSNFSRALMFIHSNVRTSFSKAFSLPYSSSAAASVSSVSSTGKDRLQKWRQPVASLLERGGVQFAREGKDPGSLLLFYVSFMKNL